MAEINQIQPMTTQVFIQQFQLVPENLKRELLDFYQYLLFQYQIRVPDLGASEPEPKETKMTDLQRFLLDAPPFEEEALDIVEQKQNALNTWKSYSSTQAS